MTEQEKGVLRGVCKALQAASASLAPCGHAELPLQLAAGLERLQELLAQPDAPAPGGPLKEGYYQDRSGRTFYFYQSQEDPTYFLREDVSPLAKLNSAHPVYAVTTGWLDELECDTATWLRQHTVTAALCPIEQARELRQAWIDRFNHLADNNTVLWHSENHNLYYAPAVDSKRLKKIELTSLTEAELILPWPSDGSRTSLELAKQAYQRGLIKPIRLYELGGKIKGKLPAATETEKSDSEKGCSEEIDQAEKRVWYIGQGGVAICRYRLPKENHYRTVLPTCQSQIAEGDRINYYRDARLSQVIQKHGLSILSLRQTLEDRKVDLDPDVYATRALVEGWLTRRREVEDQVHIWDGNESLCLYYLDTGETLDLPRQKALLGDLILRAEHGDYQQACFDYLDGVLQPTCPLALRHMLFYTEDHQHIWKLWRSAPGYQRVIASRLYGWEDLLRHIKEDRDTPIYTISAEQNQAIVDGRPTAALVERREESRHTRRG